ncbi:protein ARK2N isoform X3 [Aquarana catesbeiana]|uniref:protein ARK2N isoform X3 n=1 Tax=Aquarana catesbeiana TaxID=8400 RepID=UPI003CC9643E
MKMEAVGKSEQLLESEVPPVTQQKVDSPPDEGALDLQASLKDNAQDVPDSSGLSSMPCLLMELRRDSSESQLASTESDKPTAGRVYESDSSNHCMLSPSSSGHLADSDTLSSAEENEPRRPEAITEGCDAAAQGAVVARKSRRSRSESETSTMAAKKNRQSSDKQNGRVTKVKGHRSQKHKERIRLLRQKREAAARKKYNLLQDSSTSDSDLTCDSSTSSSDDDEEVSGSSKTITAEIPGQALKIPQAAQGTVQHQVVIKSTGKRHYEYIDPKKLEFLLPFVGMETESSWGSETESAEYQFVTTTDLGEGTNVGEEEGNEPVGGTAAGGTMTCKIDHERRKESVGLVHM